MKDIFAAIGVGFTVYSFVYLIGMLGIFICEKIKILRTEYKIKHKFDKPPAAKCYCKDCLCYNDEDAIASGYGHCGYLGLDVDDDWFCWRAMPKE